MPIDSSSPGYLAPSAEPLDGAALDKVFHDFIVGLTGIEGDLARPRWQPEPAQQPAFGKDWVAFGIVRRLPDMHSYSEEIPGADGASEVSYDELLYVLHSFYGPNSSALSARFKAGCEVAQNRATIRGQGVLFREVQEPVILPALLKEKWVKRIDVTAVFARRAVRTYPILIIDSGQLGLDNEHYVTPIQIPTN